MKRRQFASQEGQAETDTVKSASDHGKVRIGISGWMYKPWRGVFYPEKLPHKRELSYAAGLFPSIEVNGTFYSLQRPSSFERWARETPDDFVFSLKGSRYITHLLRLRNVEPALANFFASGMLKLGAKLGPILWQFPANFQFVPELIEDFFRLLPATTEAAARLAELHDERLKGRACTTCDGSYPMRYAMEIRHQSFARPEFMQLLRRYGVALVCADAVEWPLLMDVTADFIYCRLHGSEVLYASGYEDDALDRWAARVAAWARGENAPDAIRADEKYRLKAVPRDVYVYFDNDAKVRAPFDAQGLQKRAFELLAP